MGGCMSYLRCSGGEENEAMEEIRAMEENTAMEEKERNQKVVEEKNIIERAEEEMETTLNVKAEETKENENKGEQNMGEEEKAPQPEQREEEQEVELDAPVVAELAEELASPDPPLSQQTGELEGTILAEDEGPLLVSRDTETSEGVKKGVVSDQPTPESAAGGADREERLEQILKDQMSEKREAQDDELLVLSSIYEEEFHKAESGRGGEIRLCLELPRDFKLSVTGEKFTEHSVSFLPPLTLSFELPADYPSSSPPSYTLSSKWLSRAQLGLLCERLDELWEENRGCEIIFTWILFLKLEAQEHLGVQSPLEVRSIGQVNPGVPLDPRAVWESEDDSDILPQLLDFDACQKKKEFDNSLFCCGICFADKLGADWLLFEECQHVYCKACMTEYFKIQIRDGKVRCLNCSESECTSVAIPSQVKELVGEEEFARYDRLLLQSCLDLMADLAYCPRKACHAAVLLEPDSTLGECSSCCFAFCTLCKRTYHGLSSCRTTDELKGVRDEYLAADPEAKRFLEQRYGRRVIQRAVEEASSNDWLQLNSKNCPHCHTHIEKIIGCNKMTCSSCHHYFCWLCLGPLSRADPYSHFDNPNFPCFDQLFLGWEDDDEE